MLGSVVVGEGEARLLGEVFQVGVVAEIVAAADAAAAVRVLSASDVAVRAGLREWIVRG